MKQINPKILNTLKKLETVLDTSNDFYDKVHMISQFYMDEFGKDLSIDHAQYIMENFDAFVGFAHYNNRFPLNDFDNM